jgi:UDP-N-acetylglucosamine:LPS N-acetylglucosamine transferase
MGAGHLAAAEEFRARFASRGDDARVVDILDAVPRAVARSWIEGYRAQLRWAPGSYERSYREQYRNPQRWTRFIRLYDRITGAAVQRWLDEWQPDLVVSTYSFASQVFGERRRRGACSAPLVNVLTDFGVHPLLVHPGIDLHLAAHPVVVERARQFTDRPIALAAPLVRTALVNNGHRPTRSELGLADGPLVVVTTGSWGTGSMVDQTVTALVDRPSTQVVIACGRDDGLRNRLAKAGLGQPLGWTPQLHRYVATADVLVENAGGLTAFESLALGTPLVSHRVIPGHGRDNRGAMATAGLTTATDDEHQLRHAVDALLTDVDLRQRRIAAGRHLFTNDPMSAIDEFLRRR